MIKSFKYRAVAAAVLASASVQPSYATFAVIQFCNSQGVCQNIELTRIPYYQSALDQLGFYQSAGDPTSDQNYNINIIDDSFRSLGGPSESQSCSSGGQESENNLSISDAPTLVAYGPLVNEDEQWYAYGADAAENEYNDLVNQSNAGFDSGGWNAYGSSSSGSAFDDDFFDSERGFDGNSGSDGIYFDPISVLTGSVVERQVDYRAQGLFPLMFKRHYVSTPILSALPSVMPIGAGWRSNFDRILQVSQDGQSVHLLRSDGSDYVFSHQSDGNWAAPRGIAMRLYSENGSWRFITPGGGVEVYDSTGRPISFSRRTGLTQTISYDNQYRISAVADPNGRTIQFSYNAAGLLQSFITPTGATYKFEYDATSNLTSVKYPDGVAKSYKYENTDFIHALTGVFDELGQRVSTWSYDGQGHAISNSTPYGSGMSNSIGSQTFVTMPLGAQETVQRSTLSDGRQVVTSVSASCANCGPIFTTRTFDANGYLTGVTDAAGITNTYVRDAAGRVTSKTLAAGTPQALTKSYVWHPQFFAPTDVTVGGISTHYDFDVNGNVVRRNSTDGSASRVWTYSYNGAGQRTKVIYPDGSGLTMAYDGMGNIASITDALGHTTLFTSWDTDGHLLSLLDVNGISTTFQYDIRGRLISRSRAGQTATYAWNASGQLATLVAPSGVVRSFVYDGAHRLVESNDSAGRREVYTLNAIGKRTKISIYNPDGTLARARSFNYDELGRMTQVISGQAQVTRLQRDALGRLVGAIDPLGRTVQWARDPRGRIFSVTDPMGGTTQLDLDPMGRIKRVADPRGLSTGFGSSLFGDLLQLNSPDTGGSSSQYDVAGYLQSTLNAAGQLTRYTFDAGHRIRQVQYADGKSSDFTYDQGVNANGRLTQVVDPSGFSRFQYDANGNIIIKTLGLGGVILNIQYKYDAAGRLTEVVYPSGMQVDYGYGVDNLPQRVSVNGKVQVANIAYDGAGIPISWQFANGQQVLRAFDYAGRPTQNSLYGIVYDDGDRLTAMAPTVSNVVQRNKQYSYDMLDRLVGFNDGRQPVAYGYDRGGNRVFDQIGAPADANAYSIDSQSNRLLSVDSLGGSFPFLYDRGGNTINRGGMAFSYDAAGRLVGAGGVTYSYNAFGQRVIKTSLKQDDTSSDRFITKSGVAAADRQVRLFVYDLSGQQLGEYFGQGQKIEETVYLSGFPILVQKGSSVFYIHTDHLGAPRQITDSSATPVWFWEAATFGSSPPVEYYQSTSIFKYNLRFPGQYYDAESGLFYNWRRYYDSQLGRYTQSDPIGLYGGSNTYAYVGSNPMGGADFRGESNAGRPILGSGVPLIGALFSGRSELNPRISSGPEFDSSPQLCADRGCAAEKAQCRSLCTTARFDPDVRNVYGGSFKRCMNGCVPARCGGNLF